VQDKETPGAPSGKRAGTWARKPLLEILELKELFLGKKNKELTKGKAVQSECAS